MSAPATQPAKAEHLADLEARVALAETINRLSAHIASKLDLADLVEEVVGGVKDLLEAEAVAVIIRDEGTGELVFHTAVGGAGGGLNEIRLAPGEGIAGWVCDHREPIAIPDVQADERFCARVDDTTGFVTRSVVAAPIAIGERFLGVLEAVNRVDGTGFGVEHAQLLAALARHVAVALQNAQTTHDLVERKRVLEQEVERTLGQIIAAKQEWERTFDAIADPMVLVDRTYAVRRANLAVARRAERHITQVPGSRCHEILFHRATPCPGCPLARAFAGEAASVELKVAGGIHEASHFPITDSAGDVQAVACTYRDMTQTREMERRLWDSERMASVGELAAGVAHEINNPMAFLSSNLRTLREYFDDLVEVARNAPPATRHNLDLDEILEDGPALLSESEEGAERVVRIVRELQTLTAQRREQEEVRLEDALERVVRRLLAEFPDAVIDAEDPGDIKVYACRVAIDQTLSAILKNAVQAAPKEPVTVRIREQGDEVCIDIQDSGPGIPEGALPRVFDPFYTTRRARGGLGLGLTTAHAAVRGNRGSLEIHSSEEEGTRVHIRLPTGVESSNPPENGTLRAVGQS